MSLEPFGWNDELDRDFAPLREQGLVPGRVLVQQRGALVVQTDEGERPGRPSGRLRHEAGRGGLPVAGDWVGVRPGAAGVLGTIEAVLPRHTAFVRKVAGDESVEQVLAANLDVAFAVAALPDGLNVRRLERLIALAWESGATPVVVLTKRDLTTDLAGDIATAEATAIGVPLHAISSKTGEGVDELRTYFEPNRTAALLGPSGVGKSSLVNRLLGVERQAVAEIREDGRGRHTTTHRELVALPGGGLLLDTPGVRKLALWGGVESVEDAFGDISDLEAQCRFNDCAHETEPGCAVLAAVQAGKLTEDRLESYRKLVRELAYLERRRDARAQADEKRRWKQLNKEMRGVSRTDR